VSLTAADVAEIMRLLEESSFDELSLEMEGIKLNLRKGGGRAAREPEAAPAPVAAPTAKKEEIASKPAAPVSTDPNVADVEAPLLGTFYRSPKPGAPPFVEVGADVEADTVVAIIEVMKLMNTVRAGVKGKVTEILPSDGTLVEYGQPLMRVRKLS
jgi:acetyl-CoA carboxylase biotin carboxyl carrier protein